VLDVIRLGAGSLSEVIDRLPGVYPEKVAQTVRRCASSGQVGDEIAAQILRAGRYDDSAPATVSGLPLAHPADYEWHFGSESAALMADLSMQFTSEGDVVLLLGVPTLAAGLRGRNVTLLDRNPAVIQQIAELYPSVRASTFDLFCDPLPETRASVVVLDPPWYLDHMKSFVWAAAALCIGGGHVIASVPPDGARSGVRNEWPRFATWCEKVGLQLVERRPGALSYISPLFEVNALQAAGVTNISATWRKGDLAVFRLAEKPDFDAPPRAPVEIQWDELRLGAVRIKLRRTRNAEVEGDPRLRPLVRGDVMPTVSRHNRYRTKIDVWTSGNRIFRCGDLRLLRGIIECIRHGKDEPSLQGSAQGDSSIENEYLLRETHRQLQELVLVEQEESERWIRRVSTRRNGSQSSRPSLAG